MGTHLISVHFNMMYMFLFVFLSVQFNFREMSSGKSLLRKINERVSPMHQMLFTVAKPDDAAGSGNISLF
jgi:hypothetical protein